MDDEEVSRTWLTAEGCQAEQSSTEVGVRGWQGIAHDQFIQSVDANVCWYSEKQIKVSLRGSMPLFFYREVISSLMEAG